MIDLSVTWDPEWPVVLEASWGVFMTVLVGGSFLAFAGRPARAAPVTLLVALVSMLVSAAAGLEWQVLGYAALLAFPVGLCAGYLGLVSFAFPLTWAGLGPLWSALCLAWGATVAGLAVAAPLLSGAVRAERTSRA